MTPVVTAACIAGKYTDCVPVCPVCPVDGFHGGETMFVIVPDDGSDCGPCEPECPGDAIRPDTDPEGAASVDFNARHAALWPVIAEATEPLPDAAAMEGVAGTLDTRFSPRPAAT